MSADKDAFLAFNETPIAVRLKFQEWGRICGALNAMADMLEQDAPFRAAVLAWREMISQQVASETWNRVGSEKEAANEDAN